MSYVSLARKYRPRRFIDMVGQESTTLALTNAIRLRREPHSVIFTGVRGVGKTTSARIYAKALNCENGPTADPCDVCASCMAIVAGNHEDVLEIDGASNTGVDDVRALQETLSYVPQRSTYKIYIIDEVHMLSISAFNALLKTLEEPPQHVVFIFATTELHKVPETIQSRCQTFHLQKISRPVIIERVRSILTSEGIPFDEAALGIVAREGRGSMRDALTMLDQAIAVGGGQVSVDALRNMVGSSSQALPVLELMDGLLRKDAGQILEVIARWDQEGLAMSTLAEETAKACRNAFILRDLKGQAIDLQLLELEDREQQMLLELGEKAAPMDLNRLFRQLAKCLDDLRHSDLDRFVLENYCLEWCFDPGLPDLQSLMNLISSGQPLPQVTARPAPQAAPAEGSAVNLRERWKTSSPAAPAARPASTPNNTPAGPGPAAVAPPASKPIPAPPGKATSPQAHYEKSLTPQPGPGAGSQAAAVTQPMSMARPSEIPIAPPQGLAAVSQATALAQPMSRLEPGEKLLAPPPASGAVNHAAAVPQPTPKAPPSVVAPSGDEPRSTTQPSEKSTAPQPGSGVASPTVPVPQQPSEKSASPQSGFSPGPTVSKAQPVGMEQPKKSVAPQSAADIAASAAPLPSGMSSLAQRLARVQAAQAATQAAALSVPQPSPLAQAASRPPVDLRPRDTAPADTRSAVDNKSLSSAQPAAPQPAERSHDIQKSPMNSSPGRPGEPAAAPFAAQAQRLAKPQPPAGNQMKSGALPRKGAQGPSTPPDPLPPFDPADDEMPPWVLQEEAARHVGTLAPLDEPVIPEPPKNESFLQQMARRAPATPPVEAPKVEIPVAPPAAVHEPVWPDNWRAFVDEWKKQKPLQGRVLEEAYLLEYSQQRIRLAVEPTSMAGGKLLQQDVRRRLMEQFTQLFGFNGVLEAVPKADAHPAQGGGNQSPSPDLGETLLDVKNREREVAREQLRHRLEEHPMTREVISRFGGTIEQIELQ
ncbi:MAG TPA: DNA polymerase III subunit gamma/tau [Oligoflexus sp.]|uniref:DNA polymerase III subunit gamma/tau n=1 Tax=Oligoflexus sp. TaxID=1971216 RepID=UPI002D2653E9|nr:DNA polymerase III subunit gamma/tau [Oligoflexus sp.]HYX32578.1 DNA polymerase III subunit gamma/tau [Oligoflexus sp.]